MKVGIAGCSFWAATQDLNQSNCTDSADKHFTEIIANHFNWEYITLARGACGNTAIRLQIDELVKQQVDLIIFGITSFDRIEIRSKGEFEYSDDVYSLDYYGLPDRSALNSQFYKIPSLISQSINNITRTDYAEATQLPVVWTEQQCKVITDWFNLCYSPGIKQRQDEWIIHSTIEMLERSGIPYYCVGQVPHHLLTHIDSNRTVGPNHSQWKDLDPWQWPRNYVRRYHTTDETQSIGADNWIKYLQGQGYLVKSHKEKEI
jgi:hypothetical protein|tara:strand:+ start:60 stop:842 length:783 start_codon:yes stop_codon:yes gene_type:complete